MAIVINLKSRWRIGEDCDKVIY